MIERRLYLIRHGRPDYDSTDRLTTPRGEQYDPPLGEVGLEQARLLADRLSLLADRRPPSTPPPWRGRSRRHRSTPSGQRLEVIQRDDLCEWFGGEWEEKDFEQIFREHPEAIESVPQPEPRVAPRARAARPARTSQARCVTAIEDDHRHAPGRAT